LSKIKYKRPVLAEAVFELRFPINNQWGMRSFVDFANKAASAGYTEVVDGADGFQFSFLGGEGNLPEVKAVARRIQTWNKEKTQLLQASPELFAVNRRSPYEGWEKFSPNIYKGFEIYSKIAKPKKADAMVISYINQIKLPNLDNLSDYIVSSPPIISYGDRIENFGYLIQQSFKDGDIIAVSTGRNPSQENTVIDLNIVYTTRLPSLEIKNLKKNIEKGHQRIISAFEMSITDKQRERMEVIK
jgi:uncharacterized protein (TIGR04255 family)